MTETSDNFRLLMRNKNNETRAVHNVFLCPGPRVGEGLNFWFEGILVPFLLH